MLGLVAALGAAFAGPGAPAGPPVETAVRNTARVTIGKEGSGFRLLRDGARYPIKGACLVGFWEEFKAAGGNSIRTWGSRDDPKLYDQAAARGLTVCAGLWFDWLPDDPEYMEAQFAGIRSHVQRYRDHPAILLWGIGNEYEREVDNPRMWQAIERIAQMIKQVDPNHPAITVVAEVSREKIAAIEQYCPSLDALGVNSYGGLLSLAKRLADFGWEKPYLVTEFGELGPQEVGRTSWGAPIEADSTFAADRWIGPGLQALAVEMEKGRCLGSYLYLWGVHEQFVHTDTWYQLFLRGSGERLGGVDAATVAWTGKPPPNRAPRIISFEVSAALKEVLPGSRQTAAIAVRDPDGDSLQTRWEVRAEAPALGQAWPASYPASIVTGESRKLLFAAPQEEGAYRIYAYVSDGKGAAATANLPFFVKAPP